MMHSLVVVLAVLAAGPKSKAVAKPQSPDAGVAADALPPTPPPILEQAGEVKEIELDERRARAVYRIRTAISIPAVVEFPESFAAAPACGDCADALKPGASSALFALQAEANGSYLIVKPRLYPGPQADGSNIPASDFVTTITVRLQSLTLTLQVELTENKSQADARVRFVLPNRGAESRFVTESIAKAKSALEADFASRVEASAADQLLRSFLEPHECRSNRTRQRLDDMVLELHELCRFGRRLYVRFQLENRGRALFILDSATAGMGDGKDYTPVEVRWLTSLPEVAFQQTTEGIVSFDVDDPSAHKFELKLTEKGGRTRAVALQGFGF